MLYGGAYYGPFQCPKTVLAIYMGVELKNGQSWERVFWKTSDCQAFIPACTDELVLLQVCWTEKTTCVRVWLLSSA